MSMKFDVDRLTTYCTSALAETSTSKAVREHSIFWRRCEERAYDIAKNLGLLEEANRLP